jgi:hypothetical protein
MQGTQCYYERLIEESVFGSEENNGKRKQGARLNECGYRIYIYRLLFSLNVVQILVVNV